MPESSKIVYCTTQTTAEAVAEIQIYAGILLEEFDLGNKSERNMLLAVIHYKATCIKFGAFLFIATLLFPTSGLAETIGNDRELPYYLQVSATVPKARDARWWTKRHREKALVASAGQAEMIMIGDSLVHNFEKRGRQIWHLYFGRYKPLNLGFNADLTEHALWRLQNGELDGLSPRLAIIMIGTNNGGFRRDPAQYTYKGIAAIVEEIRSRLPDTKILLLGIFPRGALKRHPLRKLNAEVNTLLPVLGKDPSVHFMDISKVFLDDRKILHRDIMFDFLHPTVAGYQLWAEAISPTVLRLIGE